MSRRTLILIVVLIGITAVLLAIALTPKQAPTPVKQPSVPSISYAQTTLRINNNPTAVISTSSIVSLYSTDVTITTGNNMVNAVQLELSFDTTHLYNVDIKPGLLFQNGVELLKKVDSQKGFSGSGVVAVITFAEKGNPGETAQINFLPKSLVTAQGIDKSVLKTAVGATFPLSALPSRLNTGTPSAQ